MPEYTLVVRDPAAAAYAAPNVPNCPSTERYLAVHTPDGNWGIVDRWDGKLLDADVDRGRAPHGRSWRLRPPQRYVYQADVAAAVAMLNARVQRMAA